MSDVLDELVGMSAELGDPSRDLAILGEGNTSVRADEETFWIKASGTELARASRESFVRVRFATSSGGPTTLAKISLEASAPSGKAFPLGVTPFMPGVGTTQ